MREMTLHPAYQRHLVGSLVKTGLPSRLLAGESVGRPFGWLHLALATPLFVGGGYPEFGADAVTDSGYARTVREWKRGTPLSAATEVYAGAKTDIAVYSFSGLDRTYRYTWRARSVTFYTSHHEVQLGLGPESLSRYETLALKALRRAGQSSFTPCACCRTRRSERSRWTAARYTEKSARTNSST